MSITEKELRTLVAYLGDIVADINTSVDTAKSDDKVFRDLIEKYQQRRWETDIYTEGYTLDLESAIQKFASSQSEEVFEEDDWERLLYEKEAYDKICMDLAWDLPPHIVMWCFYRVLTHATTGDHGHISPPDLTWMEAADFWLKEIIKPEEEKREKDASAQSRSAKFLESQGTRKPERIENSIDWDSIRQTLTDFQTLIEEIESWKENIETHIKQNDSVDIADIVDKQTLEWLTYGIGGKSNFAGNPMSNPNLFTWIEENFDLRTSFRVRGLSVDTVPLAVSAVQDLGNFSGEADRSVLQEALKRVSPILETFYAYRSTLNSYMKQVGTLNFSYQNLRVFNPDLLTVQLSKEMLTYLDGLFHLLKERGLEKIFQNEIKGITIRFATENDKRAHAYYDSTKQWLILLHRMLDKDIKPRIGTDWPLEVVVHEFGHHLHMNFLNKNAKAFWDDPWKDLNRAYDLQQSYLITQRHRSYFYNILKRRIMSEQFDIPTSFKKALQDIKKSGDHIVKKAYKKYVMWLYSPSPTFYSSYRGKHLTKSENNPTLTPDGIEILSGMRKYAHRYDPRERAIYEKVFGTTLSSDFPSMPLPTEMDDLLQGYKSYDELIQALDLPTNYAEKNELEDFAETFMTYILEPQKLSSTARYRLMRTLALSGVHGKPVMRLSRADWEWYIDDALNDLWAPITEWIHYPESVGKKPLLEAYKKLDDNDKNAIEMDALRAIKKHHGGSTFIANRRFKKGWEARNNGILKGLDSVSTDPKVISSVPSDSFREYKVKASDVLVHWGQDTPLASKAYGHEKEVILKPGVKIHPLPQKKISAKDLSDLVLASITENGIHFETGKSVTFPYYRNTESSSSMGDRFGQNLEPAGRYLTHDDSDAVSHPVPTYEYGEVKFLKPLVLALSIDENKVYGPTGWKQRLVDFYKKKRKALTMTLLREGYDGIVTVQLRSGRPVGTSEIVDLKPIARSGALIKEASSSTQDIVEHLQEVDDKYYDKPVEGYKTIRSYLKEIRAKKLGEGYGRTVWDLGNGTVIKLAYNKIGRRQCQAEETVWYDTEAKLLVPVLVASDYERWLIMPKVKPLVDGTPMRKFFGDAWYEFIDVIAYPASTEEMMTLKKSDRNLYELAKVVQRNRLAYADIIKTLSWGKLQGKVKIFDYGLDVASGIRGRNAPKDLYKNYDA